MPISPKRRGLSELMMQYTYLPRLGTAAVPPAAAARGAVAGRPVATRAGLARAARRGLLAGAFPRALGFGFGMMCYAPHPQRFSNLHDEIFRQTRLRDEAVAAGLLRVERHARERVPGHGEYG